MLIYIDESGVFKAEEKEESISCVTALIVPNTLESALFHEFDEWKSLPSLQKKMNGNGEIKGSRLDEEEISSLLFLLSKFDVIVETMCVDMGLTTDADVTEYKKVTANSFSNSQAGQNINAKFDKNALMSLSNPLFYQSLLLFRLINNSLKTSIPYYVQRFPNELGSFSWSLDAKDNDITEYEKILALVVMPFLQSINYNTPSHILEGEDYSALKKFYIDHENLLEPLKSKANSTSSLFLDVNSIMEKISFKQSHKNSGLEIVDIVANCIKRAMNGHLQFNGWRYLSSLVVSRKEGAIAVTRVNPEISRQQPSYANFVNYFRECGKQMIVPDGIKQKLKKGYIRWTYLQDLPNKQNESDDLIKIWLEYY